MCLFIDRYNIKKIINSTVYVNFIKITNDHNHNKKHMIYEDFYYQALKKTTLDQHKPKALPTYVCMYI